MPSELTATSYAVLGLLSLRSWTTYELAQQMKRGLGQFWPRAESRLYDEPKKLVTHGLALAESRPTGRRNRTVYSITPAGREALAAWIPTDGAGPVLEFEQLIKVFFAEHGARADLLATIEQTVRWADEQMVSWDGIARGYLRGEGPFPERLPWLILCGRFLEEHVLAVRRWAEWAAEIVGAWPDDLTRVEPDEPALQHMARTVDDAISRVNAGSLRQP